MISYDFIISEDVHDKDVIKIDKKACSYFKEIVR